MGIDKLNIVESPPHYINHSSKIQCREITQYMGFFLGNSFKYLFRRDRKDTLEVNLLKAITYLKFELIKRQSGSILNVQKDNIYREIVKKCQKKLDKIVEYETNGYGEILRSILNIDLLLTGDTSIKEIQLVIKKIKERCK